MARLVLEPGRIQVLESMSQYDDFVQRFLQTLGPVEGVLVSGYSAIVLGRSRLTEDIDMLVRPHDKAMFDAWWERLRAAGFLCLQSRSRDEVWEYIRDRIAPRFALDESGLPNMEVQYVHTALGRRALDDAWDLDLLGVPGKIGDLSDQVAYKLYLGSEKDWEDAEHIASVAGELLDWKRLSATALSLEVPSETVERLHRHAQDHR